MTTIDDVAAQLADELDMAIATPAEALLGLDLADMLVERIRARALMLAGQLCQDDDDRLATETAIDIMGVLWPNCTPEDCAQSGWWRTPLGRMCARSLGHRDILSVTRHVAAAMLGTHPGTVARYVADGRLGRHPDGGITRSSVLLRLSR